MKYLLLFLLSVPAFAAAPSAGVWGWDGTHYYPSLGLGSVLQGGTGSSVGEMIINGGPQLKKFSANTLGVLGPVSDFPAVVSAAPVTNGLMIVRAVFNGAAGGCPVAAGYEGWALCTRNSTGNYVGTFSATFSDNPVCVCSAYGNNYVCQVTAVNISAVNVIIDSGNQDGYVQIICIGQRDSLL